MDAFGATAASCASRAWIIQNCTQPSLDATDFPSFKHNQTTLLCHFQHVELASFVPTLLIRQQASSAWYEEYPTVDQLAAAMKTHPTLAKEWKGVQELLIAGMNSGEIKNINRGAKAHNLREQCMNVRKKVIAVVRAEEEEASTKVRAIAVWRWQQLYPGTDPKSKGHVIKPSMIDGKLQDAVIIRVTPKGEAELTQKHIKRLEMTEILED